MSMELEFWVPDGPHGEALDFARPVAAWQIPGVIERYRDKQRHAYVILRHTSRQRGAWIVWVRDNYQSGTCPQVGSIEQG